MMMVVREGGEVGLVGLALCLPLPAHSRPSKSAQSLPWCVCVCGGGGGGAGRVLCGFSLYSTCKTRQARPQVLYMSACFFVLFLLLRLLLVHCFVVFNTNYRLLSFAFIFPIVFVVI